MNVSQRQVALTATQTSAGPTTEWDQGGNTSETDDIVNVRNESDSVNKPASPRKSTGLISPQEFAVIRIVTISLLFIAYIAGISLNILNICIYKDSSFPAVGKYYILGLSVVDILANTLGFAIVLSVTLVPNFSDMTRISINFIIISFRRFSNCVICSMSLERCLTLLQPLKASKNNAFSRFPNQIMSFFLVTVFAIGWVDIAQFGDAGARYAKTVVALFSKIAFGYVTLGLTMVFNLVTLLYLKHHSKTRTSLGASVTESMERKKQSAITRVIVAMTFIYVLLALPNTAVLIVKDIYPPLSPFGTERLLYLTLIRIGACTDTLMNISDVFVFLVLNKKYRAAAHCLICRLFRCMCLCKQNEDKPPDVWLSTATNRSELGTSQHLDGPEKMQ